MIKPESMHVSGWGHYIRLYRDTAHWVPAVTEIQSRLGLATLPARRIDADATNPVFALGDELVLKILALDVIYDGQHAIEKQALEAMAGLKVPEVLAFGRLFAEAPQTWPYLLLRRVPGQPLDDVWGSLGQAQRLDAAQQIGVAVAEMHARPIPPELRACRPSYRRKLAWQRNGLGPRLARWGTLPRGLCEQAEAFVDQYRPPTEPESMLHYDLDGSHVFGVMNGDRWELTGVIDWGDLTRGPTIAELGPLHFGLFAAEPALLTATGLLIEPFTALAAALMHDYDVIEPIRGHPALDSATLEELAERVFCV